jgi:hypothetical protein
VPEVNQDAILAEYNSLKQEIIQTTQLNIQGSIGILPIAAAIITYGYQAKNTAAFLLTIILLLSMLLYNATCIRNVMGTGAYIHAIIEPKINNLRWETMLEKSRGKSKALYQNDTAILISIYGLVSAGCIFLSWYFLNDYRMRNLIAYSIITLILVILFIALSLFLFFVSSEKYYKGKIKEWQDIENELYNKATTS